MLAYVFWHWPRPGVRQRDYERRQQLFHEALEETHPAGFTRSLSHAIAGASWAHDAGQAYEDWYLVQDSAALDSLNEAAVTGHRREPHDHAAAAAGGGTAAIYRLRLGKPPETPRHALWFTKPEGTSYESLWATLAPVVQETRGVLWSRYMVLGPSPEFCLQADEPPALPWAVTPVAVALRPVWPNAAPAR